MAKDWDWKNDQELRAWLTREWAAGTSASDIAAQRDGLNKDKVIGAAHRMGLPSRPSPLGNAPHQARWTDEQVAFLIQNDTKHPEWLAEQTHHTVGAVRTKLHVLRVSGVIAPVRPIHIVPAVVPRDASKPSIVAPPKPVAVAAPSRTKLKCQWLNGSAPPHWDQCTADATHGRTESSWCDRHRARVFVRRGHEAEAA